MRIKYLKMKGMAILLGVILFITANQIEPKQIFSAHRVNTDTDNYTKTINDFPSPVNSMIKRAAGNIFSEELDDYLFHAGTDYALSEGTVIRIQHEGTVIYAGKDPFLGEKVEIDAGDGWSIVYGGLENLTVKQGDWVNRLDTIGQVGINPGAESQEGDPQLHFEVRHEDLVQVPKM